MVEQGDDHARYIGEAECTSEAVLRAVSAVSDRPLLELPPLQEFTDADALNRLFASSTTVESLRLTYAEYEVTVEPERVRVRER
ncbi:MAG: HalOD1 output domain-containing protein [Haloplanus sp.]